MESNYDLGKGLRVLAIIAFVVFWAAAAAFVISNMSNKTYTATAQLVVAAGLGTDPTGTGDVLNAPRIGATYAELATTRPVLLDVIKRASLPYDPVELARLLKRLCRPIEPVRHHRGDRRKPVPGRPDRQCPGRHPRRAGDHPGDPSDRDSTDARNARAAHPRDRRASHRP